MASNTSGYSAEFKQGFFVGAGVVAAIAVVGFVLKKV
jgi:tetrahydromethanopterin S-methyltransferase subunit B